MQCMTRGYGLRGAAMAVLLALSVALGACGNAPGANGAAQTATRVTLVGASTISPLLAEIAKVYEQQHPGLRIEVQAGGSARGVLDVRSGAADIGMVSRKLAPDEKDLESVLIGMDGIAMIVNRANPVASFTRDDIIGIYTGRIANWKQLGGADQRILVVSKAEGRSTLEIFSHYFGLPYRDISAQVIIGDNQQGIETVARSPAAIAYVSIGTAEYEAQHGSAIRLVPLDGHVPTTAAVAAGSYPISRELNLVYKPTLSAPLRAFVAFAHSDAVTDLVRRQYFVPVGPH